MKNYGFTLAEILVTLGIIGVISALTLPTFTQKTSLAKVGPQLGKARTNFEQATAAMMQEAQSDSLTATKLCPSTTPSCTPDQRVAVTSNYSNFLFNLGHYLKGSNKSSGTTTKYQVADGTTYTFNSFLAPAASQFPHDELIDLQVLVDINGEQGPNLPAKDRFYFEMRNDGSLVPYGSADTNATAKTKFGFTNWETNCPKNIVPTVPEACAAHIFENGMKAEYK